MSATKQVTDAEVEAILDLVRPTAEEMLEVLPRDFKAPRRLSKAQLDSLGRKVEKILPDVSAHVSTWLRGPHRAVVSSVIEAHSGILIDGFVEPMRILSFDVGTQLGFVAWDTVAMVSAVETALGASTVAEVASRELTAVEERILSEILVRVVTQVATSVGVEAKNFRVLREKKELQLADDLSVSDPQRIGICLGISGAAGDSTLRIYFPAVKAPELPRPGGAKDAKKQGMPTQFGEIDLEMRAELGSVIVALQDILALEIGDVVVLDTKVGDPVSLTAEGEVRARGDLGRRDGKLALRLRSVERRGAKKTDGN